MNIVKLAVMIYTMIMGFWTTFGVIYGLCGFELTDRSLWVLVGLAIIAECLYLAWVV